MMSPAFIHGCLIASMLGVLFAAPVSVCGKGVSAHRPAQLLLALAGFMGALGAALFFFSRSGPIVLFTLPFLFHSSFVIDSLSSVFFFLISGVTAICALYAIAYVEAEEHLYHVPSLNCFTMLFVLGMQLVVLSGTVVSFMASWEIMSVSSFFLVMADKKPASVKAAFLYIGMAQLGASAILAGFLLVGGGLADPGIVLVPMQNIEQWRLILAFALFLFGFGSKAGLVPFHVWLPQAHPQAPSHISALLSAVMLKVAVYGFLRAVFVVLPLPTLSSYFGMVVVFFGLFSAIFGAFRSAFEQDLKRALAFSSIENIGLIFVMIGFCMSTTQMPDVQKLAFVALMLHIINHAFFKSGLFLSAGVIVLKTHTRNLEALGGLAKRMPFFTGAFCILALAAAALPPFGTFYGEWVFLQSALFSLTHASPLLNGLAVIVLCMTVLISAIAAFSMVRLFGIASLGLPRSKQAEHATEPTMWLLLPVAALGLLTLIMSVASPYIASILEPSSVAAASFAIPALSLPIASISPLIILIVIIAAALIVFIFSKALTNSPETRRSQTWDCGQPIDATMEYTATGFAAPLRLFFNFLIRNHKHVVSVPVVESNRWIRTHTATVVMHSRSDSLYLQGKKGLMRVSAMVRRVQSGVLQIYLLLIFLALVCSLVIAL